MGRPVHRLVDLWHLLEKLGSAAKVLQYGDEEASAQLGKWRLSLLNEDNAVEQIHKTLVDSQKGVRAHRRQSPRCMKPSPTLRITARTCGMRRRDSSACRSALAT